jgi:hypothetical protein
MTHAAFGPIVMTAAVSGYPDVVELLPALLQRFYVCDWGDLDPEDARANDDVIAGKSDAQILASYPLEVPGCGEPKLWIICNGYGHGPEPDHCHTTVLFPSDY